MIGMQFIGLTGGIAAGKSAVAARLAEHGAVVIDADAVAREVVEPGTLALAKIAEAFGPAVIDERGRLDRPALAAIVFTDPQQRKVLEGITHPAIGRRVRELAEAATAADPEAIVVYDVPLLAEGARHDQYDLIVVVHANAATRLRRLIELRGMSPEQARARIDSQAGDEQRLALADVVIDANGSLEQTLEQTDVLWRQLRAARHRSGDQGREQ